MSYVQGTKVRVTAEFVDVTSGLPVTGMADVVLTIEQPDGVLVQRSLSANQVFPDPTAPGSFYSVIDTALLPGIWYYQFESTGPDAVVGRKQITVKKRLPVPT